MCVCVSHSWAWWVYLICSNESVHSQVVLHHFLCHVWWVGQHSALEQSGGASLTRLARRTGGLDVTEECVPRLEHRKRQIQERQAGPSQTWARSIPAAYWLLGCVMTGQWKAGWMDSQDTAHIFVNGPRQLSYQHTLVPSGQGYAELCFKSN